MASLTTARETVAREAARALPPDDPLRPLVDALVQATAALEAAEARISADATDRLARAAAYGASTHMLAFVRAEMRKRVAWMVGAVALAWMTGAFTGWMAAFLSLPVR